MVTSLYCGGNFSCRSYSPQGGSLPLQKYFSNVGIAGPQLHLLLLLSPGPVRTPTVFPLHIGHSCPSYAQTLFLCPLHQSDSLPQSPCLVHKSSVLTQPLGQIRTSSIQPHPLGPVHISTYPPPPPPSHPATFAPICIWYLPSYLF